MTKLRLSDLKPNQTATIKAIEESGQAKRRIMEMGLVRGSRVRVICRAPLGDPIEVEVRDYKLSLRRRDAENIIITEGA